MRVYVPATAVTLSALHTERTLASVPITAFAVTQGLRDWYVDDDEDEELEYAAFSEAARASLRLLGAHAGAPARRAVLSVDVADTQIEVRDDLDRGVVRVLAPVPLAAIAAIHVDDADAAGAVAAAAAAIDAADLGDQTAQDTVDDADGFELSWYAPQELEHVLSELTGG